MRSPIKQGREDDIIQLCNEAVVGEFLPWALYILLDRSVSFLNTDEGFDYWYDLKPVSRLLRPALRRPWTEQDRNHMKRYLGYNPPTPEEDIWI